MVEEQPQPSTYTSSLVECAMCQQPVEESSIYTCISCYFPFCSSQCVLHHFRRGFHLHSQWLDDGIEYPLLGAYTFRNDGDGHWIPATEASHYQPSP